MSLDPDRRSCLETKDHYRIRVCDNGFPCVIIDGKVVIEEKVTELGTLY